jgi:hypothetical protein
MKLSDIIGSSSAISHRKASLAYDYILSHLQNTTSLQISFEGLEDLSSAFVNAWIGKLYMENDPAILDIKLSFIDLPSDGIWETKINRAKVLGSNEELRKNHHASLSDLIAS